MRDQRDLDRRRLLAWSAGALGAWSLSPTSLRARPRAAWRAQDDPRTLVLVQLSGGNDGLSTIVPYGDDAYHVARNTTHVAEDELLRIDAYRGFHPRLERLRALYGDGGLAIVEGAGYPSPNRSHFRSMDIWHTADARGRGAGEGWVGRLCAAAYGDEADPNRVVHVGGSTPYSLFSSRHPAISFALPSGYRWIQEGGPLGEVAEAVDGEEEPASLAHLREVMHDARSSSRSIRSAASRYRPRVEYPRTAFAQSLRVVAALIEARIGARILSVELSGFDTHNNQRGRHDQLMGVLDEGLGLFLEDIAASEAGRNTLVLAFSEFGRRVAENGSRGTDHGCAGPMFLAGARVEGGLHGAHPSLTELDSGDLVYTTDFRSVYAAALEATFDVGHEAVFGRRYPELDLVS